MVKSHQFSFSNPHLLLHQHPFSTAGGFPRRPVRSLWPSFRTSRIPAPWIRGLLKSWEIMGNLLEMEVFTGENRRITWGISLKMGKIIIESRKTGIWWVYKLSNWNFMTGWWFGTMAWNFMTFHSVGNDHHPNWWTPSFCRGVGWNHQPEYIGDYTFANVLENWRLFHNRTGNPVLNQPEGFVSHCSCNKSVSRNYL